MSFQFHTASEQNFSRVNPASYDENVTKGFWRQAESPGVLGTKGLCMAGAAGLEPVKLPRFSEEKTAQTYVQSTR